MKLTLNTKEKWKKKKTAVTKGHQRRQSVTIQQQRHLKNKKEKTKDEVKKKSGHHHRHHYKLYRQLTYDDHDRLFHKMVLSTEWSQVEVIDLINDGSGLGFGIVGGRSTGVVIKSILPGGIADKDNRLQSGDHILQIGEVHLRGLGSEQVASVLRQAGNRVRIVVARPLESIDYNYVNNGQQQQQEQQQQQQQDQQQQIEDEDVDDTEDESNFLTDRSSSTTAPIVIVPTKILQDPDELVRQLIRNGYIEFCQQQQQQEEDEDDEEEEEEEEIEEPTEELEEDIELETRLNEVVRRQNGLLNDTNAGNIRNDIDHSRDDTVTGDKCHSNITENVKRACCDNKRDSNEVKRASVDIKRDSIAVKRDSIEFRRDNNEIKREGIGTKRDSIEVKRDSVESKLDDNEVKREGVATKRDSIEVKRDSVESKLDNNEVKRESVETKRDSIEVKRDNNEVKRDNNEVKREGVETKRDSIEIQRDSVVSKLDNNEVKRDSVETKPDNNEVTRDSVQYKRDNNEVKRDNCEIKRDSGKSKRDSIEINRDRVESKRIDSDERKGPQHRSDIVNNFDVKLRENDVSNHVTNVEDDAVTAEIVESQTKTNDTSSRCQSNKIVNDRKQSLSSATTTKRQNLSSSRQGTLTRQETIVQTPNNHSNEVDDETIKQELTTRDVVNTKCQRLTCQKCDGRNDENRSLSIDVRRQRKRSQTVDTNLYRIDDSIAIVNHRRKSSSKSNPDVKRTNDYRRRSCNRRNLSDDFLSDDNNDDADVDDCESFLPETERYDVTLTKNEYGLGITIAGYVCEREDLSGIFVKGLNEGSEAYKCGKININDRIIEVDGNSLQEVTNHEAVDRLKCTSKSVRLTLERYLRGPKYEQLQEALACHDNLKELSPQSPSVTTLSWIPIDADTQIDREVESLTTLNDDDLSELNNNKVVDGDGLDDREEDEEAAQEPEEVDPETREIFIEENFEGDLTGNKTTETSIKRKWETVIGAEAEIVVAHLTKLKGLGISLEGTVDVEGGLELRPRHYIRSILPEGPVGQNGQLNSGDELLEVNGQKLLGKSHVDVVKILRELPSAVRLVCARKHDEENRVINTSQDREAFEQRNIVGGSLKNLLLGNEHERFLPKRDEFVSEQERFVTESERFVTGEVRLVSGSDRFVEGEEEFLCEEELSPESVTFVVELLEEEEEDQEEAEDEERRRVRETQKQFQRGALLTKSLSDTSINTSSTATVTVTTDENSLNQQHRHNRQQQQQQQQQQKPINKSRSLTNLAMWSEDVDFIDLIKTDRGLGFSILDYQDPLDSSSTVIVIRSLVPNGTAELDGRVKPGDRLVSVNGKLIKNFTLDQAVQLLKGTLPGNAIRLGISKPLQVDQQQSQMKENQQQQQEQQQKQNERENQKEEDVDNEESIGRGEKRQQQEKEFQNNGEVSSPIVNKDAS